MAPTLGERIKARRDLMIQLAIEKATEAARSTAADVANATVAKAVAAKAADVASATAAEVASVTATEVAATAASDTKNYVDDRIAQIVAKNGLNDPGPAA